MTVSTQAGNEILNLYLRGVAVDVPAGLFVSLHTGDPGLNGANEVTNAAWPAYARQDATAGGPIAGAFSAAVNKISKNAKTLLFPANNGPAAVNVTHFCLWDAAAGGRASFGGPLTSARNIQPEDELVIYPNNLEVTVS